MKWIGIAGSRKTNNEVEQIVRNEVGGFIRQGNGLVTGGALGVDYFALDEALKENPIGDRIKIFIPAYLDIYGDHYRQKAKEGVITKEEAEKLIKQLTVLKKINPKALIETAYNKSVNAQTYYERNSFIVDTSDELIAFQVNQSSGTQDTINKAKDKGIPVKVFKYNI